MSPVGVSRERENPGWCGEVPGWGCCRSVVLVADSADGRCARERGGLPSLGGGGRPVRLVPRQATWPAGIWRVPCTRAGL